MAAVGIHIVHTKFVACNKYTGAIVNKEDPATKVSDVLQTEHQHRIIADAAIASSTGSPTIDNYLKAEAALGYVLKHMDQTTIITYPAGS